MRFLDLFAGIGGFHIGMCRAGHHCVGAVENDTHARRVYIDGFPDTPLWGDAVGTPAETLPAHDILCGGFPCQPFSIAGKRSAQDPRAGLFYEISRIAGHHRPAYLVLENVPGLLSAHGGEAFAKILQRLDELGYDAGWQVLRGEDWLPQARHRLWIVACLRGSGAQEVLPLAGGAPPRPREGHRIRSGSFGDRYDIVTDGPAKTLMAGHDSCANTGIYRTPQGIRRLTPLECERISGFPDHWTASAPETARYRLLGNSCMPPVVEFLAKRLYIP